MEPCPAPILGSSAGAPRRTSPRLPFAQADPNSTPGAKRSRHRLGPPFGELRDVDNAKRAESIRSAEDRLRQVSRAIMRRGVGPRGLHCRSTFSDPSAWKKSIL